MVELLIHGGQVVTPSGIAPGWVAVNDGRIVATGCGDDWRPEASRVIDVAGKFVLPGVIDSENHPSGATDGPTVLQETKAGIASGVTTIGIEAGSTEFMLPRKEFPKRDEVPGFLEVMPHVAALEGDNRLMSDYFFTPVLSEERQVSEIEELAAHYGITAFKMRLHTKGGEDIWSMWATMRTAGMYHFDDGLVYSAMRKVAKLGSPGLLLLHCENWGIARVRRAELIAEGRTDPAAWHDMSPPFCEAGHIRTYAYYAKITGCPILIRHTTCEESFEEIRKARAEGVRVIGNTNTHYLTFDKDLWRTNVPHRDGRTIPMIWDAIARGDIDTISSDNIFEAMNVETIIEWERENGPIAEVGPTYPYDIFEGASEKEPDAMAGRLEALLPIMLSEGVNKGRISLERLVEVLCENPAKAFGLYPRKGVIAPGSDADLVIVDLEKTLTLTRDHVFNSSGWSIWEGKRIQGWPIMTILRGQILMEWPEESKHRRVVESASGRYVSRG